MLEQNLGHTHDLKIENIMKGILLDWNIILVQNYFILVGTFWIKTHIPAYLFVHYFKWVS